MLNILLLATLLISSHPIPNPGFEKGLWKPYYGNLPQGGGNVTLDCTGKSCATRIEVVGADGVSSDGGGMSESFAFAPGSYTLSLSLAGPFSPTIVARYGIDLFDANGNRLDRQDGAWQEPTNGNWQQVNVNVNAPAGTARAQVYFHLWQEGFGCGYFYFDNFELVNNANSRD